MRIEFSTQQALTNTRGNPQRSWAGVISRTASNAIFDVYHRSKFDFDPSWPVFTYGSCFAREIEDTLLTHDVPLLMRGHGVENRYFTQYAESENPEPGARPGDLARGVLNKYAVRSMLHEARASLGGERFPDEGLIELAEGTWFDPHSAGLKLLDRETALANRRRISAAMSEMRRARILILTLGQTETWLDTHTGLHMNLQPGPAWLKKMPDRFRFIDYGYEETYAQVVELIELVRAHCRDDLRVVLTVSPVPMVTTFRPVDVAVANSATKTMLRTIAESVSRSFDFVDYFPSYEIVTLSPVERAYERDLAHVTREAVSAVVSRFLASYYPGIASALTA